MRLFILFLLSLSLLQLCCAAQSLQTTEPKVASSVDLSRYVGTWYDIAHLPIRPQRDCYGTTATYNLQDNGKLEVINRCRSGSFSGSERSITGSAWVEDKQSNAKLRVRFFWPFSAPYWILAVDQDYQWAVVGSPNREYLWFLSRSPTIDDALYQQLTTVAVEQGYPVQDLIRTPQQKAPTVDSSTTQP